MIMASLQSELSTKFMRAVLPPYSLSGECLEKMPCPLHRGDSSANLLVTRGCLGGPDDAGAATAPGEPLALMIVLVALTAHRA